MLFLIYIESSKQISLILVALISELRHVHSPRTKSGSSKLDALKEVHMASNFVIAVVNSDALQEEVVGSALRTVYWLSGEYIAPEKYRSLLNFLTLQGCKDLENFTVGKNASYDLVQSAKLNSSQSLLRTFKVKSLKRFRNLSLQLSVRQKY